MLKFNKINVNPKGRKTGDCSIRAVAYTLGISWEEALRLQCEEAIKQKRDPTSRQVVEKVLAKYGYKKQKMATKCGGRRYCTFEMDRVIPSNIRKNKVVCNVRNHYNVIDGDCYVDSWDSGAKAVGNYYTKED